MASAPLKAVGPPPLLGHGLVSQSSSLTDPPDVIDASNADQAARKPNKKKILTVVPGVNVDTADTDAAELSTSPVTASADGSLNGDIADDNDSTGRALNCHDGSVAAGGDDASGVAIGKRGGNVAEGQERCTSASVSWDVERGTGGGAGDSTGNLSLETNADDPSPLRSRPRSKRRLAAAAAAAAVAAQSSRPTRTLSRSERKRPPASAAAAKTAAATVAAVTSAEPTAADIPVSSVIPDDNDSWMYSSDEEAQLKEDIARCLRPKTGAEDSAWTAACEAVASRPPPRSNTRAQSALSGKGARGAAAAAATPWWQRTEPPLSHPGQRKGVELRLSPAEIAADMLLFSGGVISAAGSSASTGMPAGTPAGRRTPRGASASNSVDSRVKGGAKRRRRATAAEDAAAVAAATRGQGPAGGGERERKRARGGATGGDSKMFTKHAEKKGWVVCRKCRTSVWPPNCAKHLACCSKAAA